MKRSVLIVEDEDLMREVLRDYFSDADYEVSEARDGIKAIELAEEFEYDIILLDIMLPELDGFSVCRRIRKTKDTPIIIITARSDEDDKLIGYELGADDYITKPFNPVEVTARVRSQLRRYMQLGGGAVSEQTAGYTIGGIELNDKTKQVLAEGDEVSLTPTEFEILKLLMKNAGDVLSPKEIYEKVWGGDGYGSESTVAVHIRHLREKIEINPAEPRYLKVVWAHGYKFEKGEQK